MYYAEISYRSNAFKHTNAMGVGRPRIHRGHYTSPESIATAVGSFIKAGNYITRATATHCALLPDHRHHAHKH